MRCIFDYLVQIMTIRADFVKPERTLLKNLIHYSIIMSIV